VLACLALSPTARAVLPPPDGGYPNFNTAEGDNALFNLTTGNNNTALGSNALLSNVTGSANTATGSGALANNTRGNNNTALGFEALLNNTTGEGNTGIGKDALANNMTGRNDTATGNFALFSNTTGFNNTANGVEALSRNTTGVNNTATGLAALAENTDGNYNTASGVNALFHNTGDSNIALGRNAGVNLTTGSNNIDIGALGAAGESGKIHIGRQGTQNGTFIAGISGVAVTGAQVVVNANGKLGVMASSARFKEQITPMDKTSEAILALKPVTFRYKEELDPDRIPQFGLIAEEVEKVNPDLVARGEDGKLTTVRYDAVNALLLNEFLKEHRKVEQQEATITQLKSTVAQQQKDFQATAARQQEQIEALTAGLQNVSDQIERSSPQRAPQIALNNE